MALKLRFLIDGVDLTSRVMERSWNLSLNEGTVIDTVNITLDDYDRTSTVVEGKDFIIEDFNDNNFRLFAGIISDVALEPEGIGRQITVQAQDWKVLLDKTTFTKDYINSTDVDIIQDAFVEAELTEINTASITGGRIFGNLTFRGSSLRSMLETISSITGFVWNVDPFKVLVYEQKGASVANGNLSDNPDNIVSFPFADALNQIQLGQFNAVEVRGTKRASPDIIQTYQNDGAKKFFKISTDGTVAGSDYRDLTLPPAGTPDGILDIDVNTGTDVTPIWSAQVVAVDDPSIGNIIDQFLGLTDVVWNITDGSVLFGTAPPNFANNSFRIKGKYFAPSIGLARDEEAITNAGRVFKKTITDSSIESDNQAIDLAEAFLHEQGRKDRVLCSVNRDKIMPGEALFFTCASFNMVEKLMVVRQVSCNIIGAQVIGYRLTLGDPGTTFEETLRRIFVNKDKDHPTGTSVTNVIRIRRILEGSSITITATARGLVADGGYYCDDAPTGIANAAFDSGITGFSKVKTGASTLPWTGTPSGSRSKLTVDSLNWMLMQSSVNASRPSATGLEDGILWYVTDTGSLYYVNSNAWVEMFPHTLAANLGALRKLGTGALDAAAGNHTH